MRIDSTIIFYLSKLWKAKFFILCDVIFLVRLQEKFEIDYSCLCSASALPQPSSFNLKRCDSKSGCVLPNKSFNQNPYGRCSLFDTWAAKPKGVTPQTVPLKARRVKPFVQSLCEMNVLSVLSLQTQSCKFLVGQISGQFTGLGL